MISRPVPCGEAPPNGTFDSALSVPGALRDDQFMNIKCNKCGYIGAESEFPKGHDFFQNQYIAGCPKCDNRQSPGDASMRMFGGKRPFERAVETTAVDVTDKASALAETLRRADSVS